MLFRHVALRTKSKGLPIGGPLFSKKIMLFTRVAPRTKSKGSAIHRQKSQASAADNALESVTPIEGATSVAYEEGAGTS
jgi:hypothetical protein